MTLGPQPSGWVIGGITFASTMMVLIGIFQAFAGLGRPGGCEHE